MATSQARHETCFGKIIRPSRRGSNPKKADKMRIGRDDLGIYNERVKLIANFVNAVGLGLIGFAVLRPLTESLNNADISALWWGVVGLAMHGISHYLMGRLQKEMKE